MHDISGIWVLIPVVSVAGFYIMVALIVWVVVNGRKARAAMRADVQTRMIDKFSASPEFVAFLQTDQGKDFVKSLEENPRGQGAERILGGVTRSVVLSILGLGFLALDLTSAGDEGFTIAGCILLALGIGYFIATIVTYRMSKSWGLLPRESATTAVEPRP